MLCNIYLDKCILLVVEITKKAKNKKKIPR